MQQTWAGSVTARSRWPRAVLRRASSTLSFSLRTTIDLYFCFFDIVGGAGERS